MDRTRIIKPDVINILCRAPEPRQRTDYEPLPTPEPQVEAKSKETFWGKVGGFFKKAASFFKPILTPIAAFMAATAALLNAAMRVKDSSGKKSRKKSRIYAVGA